MGSEYRVMRGLGRGVRRRCPACGSGGLFRHWLETQRSCPGCGIRLDRGESDFFLGGYTLNFIAVELLLTAFIALAVVATWPDVPWEWLVRLGAPLMVVAPVLFFPFSRTIWLAFDLAMRPPRPEDYDTAGGRRGVS